MNRSESTPQPPHEGSGLAARATQTTENLPYHTEVIYSDDDTGNADQISPSPMPLAPNNRLIF